LANFLIFKYIHNDFDFCLFFKYRTIGECTDAQAESTELNAVCIKHHIQKKRGCVFLVCFCVSAAPPVCTGSAD